MPNAGLPTLAIGQGVDFRERERAEPQAPAHPPGFANLAILPPALASAAFMHQPPANSSGFAEFMIPATNLPDFANLAIPIASASERGPRHQPVHLACRFSDPNRERQQA